MLDSSDVGVWPVGPAAVTVTITSTCGGTTKRNARNKSVATADSAESEELAGAYYVTFLGDGS